MEEKGVAVNQSFQVEQMTEALDQQQTQTCITENGTSEAESNPQNGVEQDDRLSLETAKLYLPHEKRDNLEEYHSEPKDDKENRSPRPFEDHTKHASNSNTEEEAPIMQSIEDSTRKLLAEYKALALQMELHRALLKTKEPLLFVILCLGDSNPEIISEALAILHLLSQKSENRPVLCNVVHIFDALAQVVENVLLPQETITFATLVYDILKKASSPLLKDDNKHGQNNHARKCEKSARKTKVNSSFSKSKMVYLYVPYNIFFKERRNTITQALQQEKEVLSITFDMNKCYCVIRVKVNSSPELFGKIVANLGFECYLVAQNDKNEEVKVEMKPDVQIGEAEYEYLSESDEEKDMSMDDKIVATEEDIKRSEGKQKSWFSSAASFVQRSFYW